MRKNHVKYIVFALKLVVSISLVYYLYNSINRNQSIFSSLRQADIKWISFSVLLMIPNVLLLSYKWWYLLKQISPKLSFWSAIGSTLGGLSLGLLTPGRIGEIGKGLFLRDIDKLEVTGLALIDRIFNMVAISIFGLAAIFLVLRWEYEIPLFIYMPTFIIAIIMLAIIVYFLVRPQFLRSLYENYSKLNKIKESSKHFFRSIKSLRKRSMTYMLLLSLGYQLLVAIQFFFSIKAFDKVLNFSDSLVAAFSTAFTKAVLPIGIADIGVRETAADLYFGFFMDNAAAIFNGSIFLFLLNVLFPAICGIIMLPKLNFQKDL